MRRQAFPKTKQSDKTFQLKAHSKDIEKLKNIQKELKLSNEPDTIAHLIENYKKAQLAFKELKEAKKRIAELEKMKNSAESKPLDKQHLTVTEFNHQIENLNHQIENLKSLVLSKPETKAAIKQQPKEKSHTNWSLISNEELWSKDKKYRGGSIEKLERSFEVICEYNGIASKRNLQKIAITNQVLRAVSGVNGEIVSKWLSENKEHVLEHHAKHKLLNESSPDSLVTYHNKSVELEKIIRYIVEKGLLIPFDKELR